MKVMHVCLLIENEGMNKLNVKIQMYVRHVTTTDITMVTIMMIMFYSNSNRNSINNNIIINSIFSFKY